MQTRVFVYGTLMRGEANHHLLSDAEYLGTWTTHPGFRMLHLGHYPGIVPVGGSAIEGEVYSVGKAHLIQLDRLEDCPRLYRRKQLSTPWGPAWIYLYQGERANRSVIASGNWRGQSRQIGRFRL